MLSWSLYQATQLLVILPLCDLEPLEQAEESIDVARIPRSMHPSIIPSLSIMLFDLVKSRCIIHVMVGAGIIRVYCPNLVLISCREDNLDKIGLDSFMCWDISVHNLRVVTNKGGFLYIGSTTVGHTAHKAMNNGDGGNWNDF